jgi:hypothetical protein
LVRDWFDTNDDSWQRNLVLNSNLDQSDEQQLVKLVKIACWNQTSDARRRHGGLVNSYRHIRHLVIVDKFHPLQTVDTVASSYFILPAPPNPLPTYSWQQLNNYFNAIYGYIQK